MGFHTQPLFLVALLWLMKAFRKQVITLKITNRFQTIKTRAVGEQFSHPTKHPEMFLKQTK